MKLIALEFIYDLKENVNLGRCRTRNDVIEY